MQDYLLGDEVVKSGDPNNTRVNEVMEGREKRIFDAAVDYRAGKDVYLTKFFGGVHGEFIVDVAMSLAFDLRKRYLVMVENNGAVENLPSDAMVEIPAYITDRGPEPVRVGEIPTFYKGLIKQQEAVEKLIVDAAVEHSYREGTDSLYTVQDRAQPAGRQEDSGRYDCCQQGLLTGAALISTSSAADTGQLSP